MFQMLYEIHQKATDFKLVVNKDYKDYMYKVDGVKIVNADQSQERIYSEIINFILDLEK